MAIFENAQQEIYKALVTLIKRLDEEEAIESIGCFYNSLRDGYLEIFSHNLAVTQKTLNHILKHSADHAEDIAELKDKYKREGVIKAFMKILEKEHKAWSQKESERMLQELIVTLSGNDRE